MKLNENFVLRQVADTWVVLPLGDATVDFHGMLTLNETGALLWEALEESRSYEMTSECYATDTGLAWDVKLECLDLTSVTSVLRERSQALLELRVAESEDISEVYDENNEYREEFVMDVLYDAAQQALEQDARNTTYSFTLNLVYANGEWWIMPEATLMEAVSGGILK